MFNKYYLEVSQKNDNLVNFIKFALKSKPTAIPNLSLPILDSSCSDYWVGYEKLQVPRIAKEIEKTKFLDKYLNCTVNNLERPFPRDKLVSKSRNSVSEALTHRSNKKWKNINHIVSNRISQNNSHYSTINKEITPLRERVCLACKKNIFRKRNDQKKDFERTEMKNSSSAKYFEEEVFKKDSLRVSSLCDWNRDKLKKQKQIPEINYSLNINPRKIINTEIKDCFPICKQYLNKARNSEFRKEIFKIKETKIKECSKSKNSLNILNLRNTDPIKSSISLSSFFSVERLSI
ncbi:hypothetical protein HWI79_1420 [Cryptosporidium felis]|nr:hypothetical protein HWI79_1420 [Cryptosporidium felis]